MLFAIEPDGGLRRLTAIPHAEAFRCWMSRLPPERYAAICQEFQRRLDSGPVHTSSWIPGRNWIGTVFESLYLACHRDVTAAGQFFGIILWKVMMDDHRIWSFGNYEKDGVPIEGKTYFLLTMRRRGTCGLLERSR